MTANPPPSGTVYREITETVPVLTDYNNTTADDISYLDKSTSHHNKVDAPGTKSDTTGDVTYAKGAANKKNAVT